MKPFLLTVIIFCNFFNVYSQISAITGSGDEVVLYDDGTWEYVEEVEELDEEIPFDETPVFKPKDASFLVKSERVPVGIWLNPKKWTFRKAVSNPAAEFEFQLRNDDLHAMMLTEKIEIPLTSLRSIAITNAKSIAPDIRIVKEEYLMINGNKVLSLIMKGSTQGIKFIYHGYYYSNTSGTVQMVTFTAQSLFDELSEEMKNMLNGFVVLND
jgi:hypothetical protein